MYIKVHSIYTLDTNLNIYIFFECILELGLNINLNVSLRSLVQA